MYINQLPQPTPVTKEKASAYQPQATTSRPYTPEDVPATLTEVCSILNPKNETGQEFGLNEQADTDPLTISQPNHPKRSGTTNSLLLLTAVLDQYTPASPVHALTPNEIIKRRVWVVGRASATDILINQLSPLACSLAFRKTSHLQHVIEAIKIQAVGYHQMIIVLSATLTYADLDALRQLTVSRSDISVAICFSTAHLGIISYAWALEFAAYFTMYDAPLESQRVITRLIDGTPESSVYSEVFCEWLRQYGILFEHDQEPFC